MGLSELMWCDLKSLFRFSWVTAELPAPDVTSDFPCLKAKVK